MTVKLFWLLHSVMASSDIQGPSEKAFQFKLCIIGCYTNLLQQGHPLITN